MKKWFMNLPYENNLLFFEGSGLIFAVLVVGNLSYYLKP
jgi:hypothetical protein